jgi:hypothetical protein
MRARQPRPGLASSQARSRQNASEKSQLLDFKEKEVERNNACVAVLLI